MRETILEALLDSLKILPFLLAFFVLIEFLESNQKAKDVTVKLLNGKVAPLVGGAVGIVPQCGFSVMSADLFLHNYIKVGTLLAVFVASSDEALPILMTDENTFVAGFAVVGLKLVYAVTLGFCVNLFDKRQLAAKIDEELTHEGCCNHELAEKKSFWQFIKHPLIHSAKIFAFIFIVNAVFGVLFFYFEENIVGFMSQALYAQPFVVALIGLIPNCASSVVISGMYGNGVISFAALASGLVANSGIGLAVLLRNKKSLKIGLVILALLYISGVVLGLILTPFNLFD